MSVSVIIKWGGQEYSISSLSEEDTVLDLKQSIKSLTGVLPERQKLLGLKVKGERGVHLHVMETVSVCVTGFPVQFVICVATITKLYKFQKCKNHFKKLALLFLQNLAYKTS